MNHKVLITLILVPLLLIGCNKTSIDTSNNFTISYDSNGGSEVPSLDTSNYFTISFDSNGGSEVPSFKVKEGEKINVPIEPIYDNYVFNFWDVLSGSYIHEQFTYVDGEIYYDDNYLYDDVGYLIPNSDMTFIARWRNAIDPIVIWHPFGQTALESSNLNEHVSSTAESMDIQASAESKGSYSELRRALNVAHTCRCDPDVILIANTICNGNIEDLLYEYEPGRYIEEFSEYYTPFYDVENQSYVLNSFDESIYQYVYDSNEQRVFGFPICSFDTMLWSKENEYNIPGTTTIYGFINKLKFESDSDLNTQRMGVEKYLKALSKSYLN